MNAMKVSSKQKGVTLIELMIVIIVMVILSSLAVPSFTRLIRNSRVETASNNLLVALNTARNEAIRRSVQVSICAGDPNGVACSGGVDWAQGWLMWSGSTNAAGVPSAGPPSNIIKVGSGNASISMLAPGNVVTFTPRGMSLMVGDLVTKAAPCDAGYDKKITVSLNAVGRTVTTVGLCP